MSKVRTNRSSSRLAAVQAIYEQALTPEKTVDMVAREFLAGDVGGEVIDEDPDTGSESYVPVIAAEPTLFAGILTSFSENKAQIDEMIAASLTSEWSMDRVELTLRAILEAGIAELMAFPQTPMQIIISEYIDVAKSFYDGPEVKVTNGILDKVAKILRES